ncbi:MAG: hypothetical protein ACO331_09625 [Prochlorothrix sp.]
MISHPRQRLALLLQQPDDRIDLVEAALCIAQEADPDRDLSFCTTLLDEIAASIAPHLPHERYPMRWLKVINERKHSGGHGGMRVSGSENPGLVRFELLQTPIGGLKPY